jgi:polyhydroxyalkanoate synthase
MRCNGDDARMKDDVKIPPPEKGGFDVEVFSRNLARMIEEGGKALSAYMKPREEGRTQTDAAENIAEIVGTLGQVAQFWLSDPDRTMALQADLGRSYLELWANAAQRMTGEFPPAVAEPQPRDKRFSDPEWSSSPFFDFVKQAYLLTTTWAEKLVEDADGIDPHTRHKAEFYLRQITNAMSPSNFVLTNPELLRETVTSNAENLVRGMNLLAQDIAAGKGELKIRQSDTSAFEVGRNLATTPGKVVFQNDLMQLIQYAPETETVLKTPLLIIPPWINKFYILDLTPEKSFINWCVAQGITVFLVSWANPDSRQATKTFEDYMHEGPLAAIDAVIAAAGTDKVHMLGYCVGGTLLSVALAYMAAHHDARVRSATLLTAQVDFTYAGDLKVFVDEDQLESLERRMNERGFLEGSKMAGAFNMMKSHELIWPYIVNNYMRGKAPPPFDMLYWNADATRMPAANHGFYMRNCYLYNRLSQGKMKIGDKPIKLGRIKTPLYNLATKDDHIAPAKSVYLGSRYFGGPVRFVLTGSGHIAGVINPPSRGKYQYWTGNAPDHGELDEWLAKAEEHPGSWWTDWFTWLRGHDEEQVPARDPAKGPLTPIEDAPGSYVKVRS